MKFLVKFYIITTLLLNVQVLAQFVAKEFCSLVKNGTQLKDPQACNTWIECQNLQPITQLCAQDLFYSLQTGTCVDPQSVQCISSNPCAVITSETGFVPDPLSCTHYYYCSNNVPTQGSCQNNGNYNATSETCILNSTCSIELLPNDYCNIIPEAVFIKDPANCANYRYCWHNKLINSTCPASYYFDAFEGICTQNMTKACDTTTTTTSTPPPTVSKACQQAGQFISDEETCNGYYYCSQIAANDYKLIHGTCTAGRFFKAANDGVCVPRQQIVCTYDRCAGLGYKNIQLSNLTDDNCQGYAVCQNGVQIGKGVCPNNQYFDEEQQRCTQNVIKYPACVTTTTTTTS